MRGKEIIHNGRMKLHRQRRCNCRNETIDHYRTALRGASQANTAHCRDFKPAQVSQQIQRAIEMPPPYEPPTDAIRCGSISPAPAVAPSAA